MARPSGGMDASTRRLMLIAGGLAGMFALLVGAYSLGSHQKAGIPVIEAAAGPVRVKPANPGGLQVFGADEVVPSDKADAAATVAPPPEAPNLQALKAAQEQAALAASPLPAPTGEKPATPPASASPAAAAVPAPVPMPAAIARTQPEPVSPPSSVTPARTAPPALSAPAVSSPTTGATQVQLAALTSEEQAMTEWARLAHKMPDLLGGRRPSVSRAEHDGKAWYRLRTGGFADVAQATSFCQRVREKGGACSIASF